jgi:predicted Zn-dependent protease
VQELTVAGDLPTILLGFREAADDLTWFGSCAAPTVRIDGLTVAAG